MASLAGRDISKLKAKGGGKWKYMSEKDMLEMAEKFAPYRYVYYSIYSVYRKSIPKKNKKKKRVPLLTLLRRSVFMWYMWRVEDVDTAVLE